MAMPVKAPPPPPPPPSWWSGFVELDAASMLINPQGFTLQTQATATLLMGLNLTLYKDKTGFINNVTVGGLVATDWSSTPFTGVWALSGPSDSGALFDTVFVASTAVTFGQYWTLSNEFLNVYSNDVTCAGIGQAGCAAGTPLAGAASHGFGYLPWDQIKLSLNDSFTGWPITFNPYVQYWYEWAGTTGQAAACATCINNSGDFFIGMVPTIDLSKYWGIPVTLKAPTYVTVGPSSFWGAGSSGGVGMFTTGLTGIIPLSWMPAQYGHWYVKGGFQYYDIINNNLQLSNAISACGLAVLGGAPCSSSKTTDIIVGFAGIGVAF